MSDESPITVLTEDDSWDLLSSVTLGRLVTSVDGQPDVFPVNFVVVRRQIIIRTAAGGKLIEIGLNDRVAFEADEHGLAHGWSVVVKGTAAALVTAADIAAADRAQVLPWTATVKQHYLRVTAAEITGRRFAFGSAPLRG
jgi:nitroimidazol reductase NimA-like FMN-containing flavoprotein (pyridoxamine 5'-phosphate oxidase superfamily)